MTTNAAGTELLLSETTRSSGISYPLAGVSNNWVAYIGRLALDRSLPYTQSQIVNNGKLLPLFCTFPKQRRPLIAEVLSVPDSRDTIAALSFASRNFVGDCRNDPACMKRARLQIITLSRAPGAAVRSYCR